MRALELRTDKMVTFSVGHSCNALKWRSESMFWSEFVQERIFNNLSRTSETVEEYKHLPKAERDKIKDVGGFVGGELKGGRRKADAVIGRSMITLDADYAVEGFWEAVEAVLDCTCVLYPTHSSTPSKPRYRLLIPLDRTVSSEEYEAISRKIADKVGIDMFDDSTYQPYRLMYWPSIPKDAEYDCRYKEGQFLDPDEILEEYINWQDIGEWPVSTRAEGKVRNKVKRQQDPTTKKGLIGAFCRTYTIKEAIDAFLSDVYEPCDVGGGDRYTYIEGSTSGGVVCYDDKFCYSNHSTDPASCTLCNAFDIVRLHKFEVGYEGREDAKRLSLADMKRFAANDPMVKKVLASEGGYISDDAKTDFNTDEPKDDRLSDVVVSDSWMEELEIDENTGNIVACANNVRLILNNDERFKDKMVFNSFLGRMEVVGQLPWRVKGDLSHFKNSDLSGIVSELDRAYKLRRAKSVIEAEVDVYTLQHQYHPVKDYLEGLEWDGVERLETLFIDFLGAEDNKYVRAATRAELIAAVKRIYEPGCKFDEAIILCGPQGIGKSSILSKLAKDEWFTDSMTTFGGKEAIEQLQGNWIIELGELSALKKSESEEIKRFLSSRVDSCRPAYGRVREDRPRECIFIGTTNSDTFLRDVTGERRFWPISCKGGGTKNIWEELDENYVSQLWAEAKVAYEVGESIRLEGEEVLQGLRESQEERKEVPDLYGIIEMYLEMKVPDNWYSMDAYDRHSYYTEWRVNGCKGDGNCDINLICPAMIYGDILGIPYGTKPNFDIRKDVRMCLSILEETGVWKKAGAVKRKCYGVQKCLAKGNF